MASLPSDSPASATATERRAEKRQRILLLVFASLSTFFYAGGVYGWGPMQLLLEANGNFASRCGDDYDDGEEGSSGTGGSGGGAVVVVCPDQTAAFLNCKFVSQLTLLTGTLWGMLSDRHGNEVLMRAFGICNIAGLVLLILGVRFPSSSFAAPLESFLLYGALILMGLGATVGGMLTVETGLLFRAKDRGDGGNDDDDGNKQQNRVIALLNSLFDAGAMAYLGLWAIEKRLSVSSGEEEDGAGDDRRPSYDHNPNLVAVLGGYLGLAVVCIGGYAHYFRAVRAIQENDAAADGRKRENEIDIDDDDDEASGAVRDDSDDDEKAVETASEGGEDPTTRRPADDTEAAPQPASSSSSSGRADDPARGDEDDAPDDPSYVPVAERSPRDQLLSRFFVLLGVWFSFHTASNLWTLTTARDFLGGLGDDEYGNRYLGIFTLLTPFSVVALPFLDWAVRSFGFHVALQAVNGLAIAHGIVRVLVPSLDAQIAGFVVFTFFRCFLYSVALSCVAAVVGPAAIGTATGTLFVLSGAASFANIGLAHVAVKRGGFVVPDSVFLLGTIPLVFLTREIGRALERDRRAKARERRLRLLGEEETNRAETSAPEEAEEPPSP